MSKEAKLVPARTVTTDRQLMPPRLTYSCDSRCSTLASRSVQLFERAQAFGINDVTAWPLSMVEAWPWTFFTHGSFFSWLWRAG
jgi:hypothetical protein